MKPPFDPHRSSTIGASETARAVEAIADQSDANDPIVKLGKRIGRALSLIACVVLATIVGAQLGFW